MAPAAFRSASSGSFPCPVAPGKGSRRVKSMAAAGSWPLPPGLSPVTPHQADQQGEGDPLGEQGGGHAEGEGHLAEPLPVQRRGLKAIEGRPGDHASGDAPDEGQRKGLCQDREDDGSAAEAERA